MANDDLDAAEIATILTSADASDVARLLRTPAPSSVDIQWARVSAILEANIGVSFRGATDADIAAAEKATCPWTDEVRDLYHRAELTPEQRGIALIPPGFELLSLDRLLSDHRLWIDFNANPAFGEPIDMDEEMAKPAGSPAPMMLPGFVAFAKSNADTLFVDTRTGPLHGCVNIHPDADAPWKPPLWRSLSAMLEQLAFSLERNTTFDMRVTLWSKYQPFIEGTRLVWEYR
ncbi:MULTISPECIES: hypothetical protein [unclassified Rhodococcus (in: high G+C Gram-positive bacteria)]|uniref:hypothetical protein n=1 Tax=unclassified Rhodococcus (in: high G+C Gram-positive bacteria) TaxID=192944 RepID=UPI0006FCC48A|nr:MULTISPECIES: hypothetical protein [unclassified Rhodococcus (in: high G+C Gram-positive bacteria)]KQU29439.1 hypothetical protein ASG69_07155 [Rhodococcus sp. Leaf225]KQU41099.1 hypothetical protein ASH03_19205 [Rhodococcus sp. Leaf258]